MESEYSAVAVYILAPFIIRLTIQVVLLFRQTVWPRMHKSIVQWATYTRIAIALLYGVLKYKWNQRFGGNKQVRLISRNQVEIAYTFRDTEYRLRSRVKRGASIPIRIFANDHDVTNELLPYVGPGEDFHGITYTPEDFGYESVIIRRDGMDDVVFQTWEVIAIQ